MHLDNEIVDVFNPLVSVIIITYNSSQYVTEALESVKKQTYKNIELIISDDGSTDNTINLCQDWLESNNDNFINTQLITVEVNSGIPANCNRGVKASTGEWIKLIAGDDALLNSCIFDNVNYVKNKNNVSVLFSKMRQYKNFFSEEFYIKTIPVNKPYYFFNSDVDSNKQLELLLIRDRIGFTPTSFIKKSAIENIGYFDERFKLIEDYPMWLKFTCAGYKMFFFSKDTVMHRKHRNAVHNDTKQRLISDSFIRNEKLRKEYVYPNITWHYRFEYYYRYKASILLRKLFKNNKNIITIVIKKLIICYLNPLYWIHKLYNNR